MLSGLDALTAKEVQGRKIGLVTNQTGLNKNFRPTAEVITALGGKIVALFGPEHGYNGVEQDALPVEDVQRDARTGLPVYSLYRKHDWNDGAETSSFDPPPGSLNDLDLLIFDIQDVGVRYYTYPTTLAILMEQVSLPILVIDRPDPIGGVVVEGPLLEDTQKSFVGRYSVPIRHGLTIGELALLINHTFLYGRANLRIARLEGWRREMYFDETGLPWVLPSPNLPTPQTARLYPGTCLLEGTNLSTGRGTTRPFEIFGAPWVDPVLLARELNQRKLPGLYFRETYFKPTFERYANEVCGGVQAHLVGKAYAEAPTMVRSGLEIIAALLRLYPQYLEWISTHFDRLLGSDEPRNLLVNNGGEAVALDALFENWTQQETTFTLLRDNFLLYQ